MGKFVKSDKGKVVERDLFTLGLADPLHFQSERHVAERGTPWK